MKTNINFYVFSILFLCSCEYNRDNQPQLIKKIDLSVGTEVKEYQNFIDSIFTIDLNKNELPIIGSVKKIIFSKQKMFIWDDTENGSIICVNMNGNIVSSDDWLSFDWTHTNNVFTCFYSEKTGRIYNVEAEGNYYGMTIKGPYSVYGNFFVGYINPQNENDAVLIEKFNSKHSTLGNPILIFFTVK